MLGRASECAVLARLVDELRRGSSGALVLRGAAGVGKTALLSHAAERAAGCRVTRAAGVQPEIELPFAALHQLCAPMLDRLEGLPEPRRHALATAFGMREGPPPDSFLVALGALGLLAEAANEEPLLCVIDDAQWLDRASAQAFGIAARRLAGERVGLLLATTEAANEQELAGVPNLTIEGLGPADARALLDAAVIGPLDARVAERIVAETAGNPLALLELPRALTASELAGGFGLRPRLPLSSRIEDGYRRRVHALPAASQRLLLIAAADPTGDALLVRRAAAALGVGPEAADPATGAGLLELGARVRFRHPLVRSAVYQAAATHECRTVHAALAEATDAETDPARRAWHRALATAAPDDVVALELERTAGRAQARGGPAAAGAFLEHAARLTADPGHHAARALAAATAWHEAGAQDAAHEMLETAEAGPLDALERARATALRAQIAFHADRGDSAAPMLLEAARGLEPLDARLARECYLDAYAVAMSAGRLMRGISLPEIAKSARAAPRTHEERASDLLFDGLTLAWTARRAAAAPAAARAVQAFAAGHATREEELRWLWLAARLAVDLWDYEAWDMLSAREYDLGSQTGTLALLPIALNTRIGVRVSAGDFTGAAGLIGQLDPINQTTRSPLAPYGQLMLHAWRGEEAEALKLVDAVMPDVIARGDGSGLSMIHWATALLYNALGDYERSLHAAELAAAPASEGLFAVWGLSELIEAAARAQRPERAAAALRRLAASTRPAGSEWARGVLATAEALVSAGPEAERHYRAAIGHLGRTRIRPTLARAHLLYGEWLRRERRRRDAREQLRIARAAFQTIGAHAFAARAERELRSNGESLRPRVQTGERLTAREGQIAGLARAGHSNALIGTRLFISPRTVEYHLHKVFRKLEIRSRTELATALPADDGAG